MEGYGDFCPLARAAEIYATRWTPLIIRNLEMGCSTFTEIRDGLPGISRTVLSQRLKMLEQQQIVRREDSEYRLTEAGESLSAVTETLGRWGEKHLELTPAHYDAGVVLWSFCKHVGPAELPDERLVLRFDVRDDKRYWILLQKPAAEVCMKPPGYDEDLVITTNSEWLTKWFVGKVSLGQALHAGQIELRGPRHLEQMLAALGGIGAYEPEAAPA